MSWKTQIYLQSKFYFKAGEEVVYILKNNQLDFGEVFIVEKTYCDGKFCKLKGFENHDWWRGAFIGLKDFEKYQY